MKCVYNTVATIDGPEHNIQCFPDLIPKFSTLVVKTHPDQRLGNLVLSLSHVDGDVDKDEFSPPPPEIMWLCFATCLLCSLFHEDVYVLVFMCTITAIICGFRCYVVPFLQVAEANQNNAHVVTLNYMSTKQSVERAADILFSLQDQKPTYFVIDRVTRDVWAEITSHQNLNAALLTRDSPRVILLPSTWQDPYRIKSHDGVISIEEFANKLWQRQSTQEVSVPDPDGFVSTVSSTFCADESGWFDVSLSAITGGSDTISKPTSK